MKKYLTILFILAFVKSSATDLKGPVRIIMPNFTDTTVLPQILALNLPSYIGKSVDSLFLVLPPGYTSRGFMPYGIGYSKGVYQAYGNLENNNCSVQIFIDNYQFMTFPNRTKTTTWDMNLAKKETIAFIKVWKNNKCIYNCNNPNYYD